MAQAGEAAAVQVPNGHPHGATGHQRGLAVGPLALARARGRALGAEPGARGNFGVRRRCGGLGGGQLIQLIVH